MRHLLAEETEVLKALGKRLKALRLHRNETQKLMGERLGLSRQAYARMENGDPKTPIGLWIFASSIFHRLQDWDSVLLEEENLFLRAEIEKKRNKRKRASRKRGQPR